MKNDVEQLVAHCLECQQVKDEYHHLSGMSLTASRHTKE